MRVPHIPHTAAQHPKPPSQDQPPSGNDEKPTIEVEIKPRTPEAAAKESPERKGARKKARKKERGRETEFVMPPPFCLRENL